MQDDSRFSKLFQTPVQTPSFESVHVQKTVIPEVHHETHHQVQQQQQQPALVHKHVETVPQVKVTTSHLSTQPQGKHRRFTTTPDLSFETFLNSFETRVSKPKQHRFAPILRKISGSFLRGFEFLFLFLEVVCTKVGRNATFLTFDQCRARDDGNTLE